MSQPSVASYFNSRKRAHVDDVGVRAKTETSEGYPPNNKISATSRVKRTGISKETSLNQQQKLVKFIKSGSLSPRQKTAAAVQDFGYVFASKKNEPNLDNGNKIPYTREDKTSKICKTLDPDKINIEVKRELKFDEVKSKATRSAKLDELKASLNRLQNLEAKRNLLAEKNLKLKQGHNPYKPSDVTLKEFKTIEVEVLSSPTKLLTTPTKTVPPPPDKNELMSPKSATPRKIFFSPSKDGSPSKIIIPPAYQRFQNLAKSGRPTLQLPYKYRCLIEMFKCLDSVCAMFYNRKEIITFKKLKPAVQRMLRKNFTESNLAQIKCLLPEAFTFSQMKLRNYGSTSKQDYYQLTIIPNVEGNKCDALACIDEENVLKSAQATAMNPQIIIKRQQELVNILMKKVKEQHDKFLKSLTPPIIIPMESVTRWHPDFDLDKCPDIEQAKLPQPPNIEKYASAKDILSTARNLFNCSTAMEKAMLLHEEIKNQSEKTYANKGTDNSTNLLKGVPKSLLEKVRAKQAAKALDSMTRRPSQDREAARYSRLPELARHLRSIFVTEKKGVLTLEAIIKRIENSFRTNMSPKDIEDHLRLLAQECSSWIVFHEIRKTLYIKMDRDVELSGIIHDLEKMASKKVM